MSGPTSGLAGGAPDFLESMRELRNRGVLLNVVPMFLASTIGQFGQWLISVTLANGLGPMAFGRFSFGYSICMLLVTLTAYGMPVLLVRTTVQGGDRRILTGSVILRTIMSAGILGIGSVLVLWLVPDSPGRVMWFLWLTVPVMMALDVTSVLDANGVARYEAYLQLTRRALYLILVLITVLGCGRSDPATPAAGFVVSTAVFVLIQWRLVRKYAPFRIGEGWNSLVPAFLLGSPLFLSSVMVNIQAYADGLIVRWLRGAGDLGIYAAANQHFILAAGMLSLLNRVLYPSLCQSAERGREMALAVRRSVNLNVAVMSLAGLGLAVAAPMIVRGVLQPEYRRALPVLLILSLGLPLVGLGAGYGRALLALGSEGRFTLALTVGALVDILLNIVAVPRWGIEGAAGATVLSYAALAGANMILYRRARVVALVPQPGPNVDRGAE